MFLAILTMPAVQVVPVQGMEDDQSQFQERLKQLAKSAAEWQANGLKRQGSGTGACLRTNLLLMADTVLHQDAHLLEDAEKQLIAVFKVQHSQASKALGELDNGD